MCGIGSALSSGIEWEISTGTSTGWCDGLDRRCARARPALAPGADLGWAWAEVPLCAGVCVAIWVRGALGTMACLRFGGGSDSNTELGTSELLENRDDVDLRDPDIDSDEEE